MASKIEWLNGGNTWNPIIARVRPDAAQIAQAKGYASLVNIAEKSQGKRGHHCEHVHAGCQHCYAEAMNGRRLPSWGTGLPYDRRSRDLLTFEIHEETLVQPLHWKKPRSIFPCSMTDLFGEWVPVRFIAELWAVMSQTPQHRYIVLTKRPGRMRAVLSDPAFQDLVEEVAVHRHDWCHANTEGRWPLPNVILGTSASDQATLDAAAPDLMQLGASGWHTVLSLEPLLGPVDLFAVPRIDNAYFQQRGERGIIGPKSEPDDYVYWSKKLLNWVIVGGESGHGARPMHPDWVRSVRDQCQAAGVPFFFKQWGEWRPTAGDLTGIGMEHRIFPDGKVLEWANFEIGPWSEDDAEEIARVGKKQAGRILDGREWNDMPEVLR